MAYASKFAELYKLVHPNYHYLCHLLAGCVLGLDLFGILYYLKIENFYTLPLLAVGILALFAFYKRKSTLSVQAYQKASKFALLNLAALLLMMVLL